MMSAHEGYQLRRVERERDQVLRSARAARASLSCLQLGAYFRASSYFASASAVFPRLASASPHVFSGSAQCGPRLWASANLFSAAATSPCFSRATPQE